MCAGAANMHFSCFSTHPCFSILCAGAVNMRLYVKLCQNASARAGLAALICCAQARQRRIFRLFGPAPCCFFLCAGAVNTQLLSECMITPSPEGPFLLCAGAANTHILSFWTPMATRVAHPVPSWSHRALSVITPGALAASLDDPSCSSGPSPDPRVL